jgi:hypothetical protein
MVWLKEPYNVKKGLMKNCYESKKDWNELLDDNILCYMIPDAVGVSPYYMFFKKNSI